MIGRGDQHVKVTKRRQAIQTKLDRRYEDFPEGRISDTLWARKSEESESELGTIDGTRAG